MGSHQTRDDGVAVTVIIPSYNSRNTIHRAIQALRQQIEAPPFEVIVVDSSNDGTERYIAREFPEVNLQHLEERTYQARSRNIGASMARGAILAFLDSDCTPRPDWLAKTVQAFDRDEVCAVGGQLDNANPQTAVSRAMFILQFRESLPYREWMTVFNMPANNIAYRRDTFLSLGGFPEWMGSSEETLFHSRLQSKGIALFVNPEARVAHWNLKKCWKFLRHQIKQGRFYRIARLQTQLPGSPFLNRLWATPLFPFYRFFRALPVLRRQVDGVGRRLITCAPLFGGFVFYSVGEILGHFDAKRKETTRYEAV